MPSRKAVHDLLDSLQVPHRAAIRHHLATQQDVGRRADLVVKHEGWQVFLDHLQAVKDQLDGRAKTLADKIARGPELDYALASLKLELRDVEGEARGITRAMELIPRLIEDGVKAGEALEGAAQ